MSKRSAKKKGGHKRLHPNVEAYNDLVAAYKEAFPGMNHEDAKQAAKPHWYNWKGTYGLGM